MWDGGWDGHGHLTFPPRLPLPALLALLALPALPALLALPALPALLLSILIRGQQQDRGRILLPFGPADREQGTAEPRPRSAFIVPAPGANVAKALFCCCVPHWSSILMEAEEGR